MCSRWRRRRRARSGADAGAFGPRRAGARSGARHRRAHVVAQQRGHPRRPLLPERHACGSHLFPRARDLLYDILRRAWRAASAPRQDCGRAHRGRSAAAAPALWTRRARPASTMCAGSNRLRRCARAKPAMPRRLSLAVVRHCRQPCADAGLSRRSGGRGRHGRVARAGRWRTRDGEGFVLDVGGAEPMTLDCRLLINCAGHGAPPLARRIAGIPPQTIPAHLFQTRRLLHRDRQQPPFRRLIYPVHGKTGMDIHAVIDLAGHVRFGPDVEWIDRLDYTVDPGRAEKFLSRPSAASGPAFATARCSRAMRAFGRASAGRAQPPLDFQVRGPAVHGVPGSLQPVRHRVAGLDGVARSRRIRHRHGGLEIVRGFTRRDSAQ